MIEHEVFLVFASIALLIGFTYAGLILYFRLNFKSDTKLKETEPFEASISLIVPFRNEEKNLLKLLQSIVNQEYPLDKIELIFVDDSSTDNSLLQLQDFKKSHPKFNLKLLELAKEIPGASSKKQALHLAFSKASGDYIFLSDADCWFGKNNIQKRLESFRDKEIKLLSAAVLIQANNSFFSKMQALENLSLMASTAASTSAHFPILSNGANLAFERKAFLQLPENALHFEENSGDDLFLLHSFKKQYGSRSIAYNFDTETAVYTHAQINFKAFLNQRIRWISKSKSYTDYHLILVSILVFLMNLSLVITAFSAFFSIQNLQLLALLFLIKFCVDFPLLLKASRCYHQSKLLWLYPFVQIFYPFFIVFTGLFGQFLPYEWKGRKY